LTPLVDEQLINSAGSGYENLSATQGIAVSQALIDASLAGDYAALMTQFHVDYYGAAAGTWAACTMDYASSHGVPMWNADQWLTFTQTRHDANYTNVAWASGPGTLSFDLTAATASGMQLTTILPLTYGGRSLQSVKVDNVTTAFSTQTIKGTPVAFV